MSAIYFHSPHGEARLSGAERAHMGRMTELAAFGAVGLPSDAFEHWIFRAVRPAIPLDQRRWVLALIRHGSSHRLTRPDGTEHDTSSTLANTAIVMGSPAMALAARLNGSCESHCYVEGVNRAWLASLIGDGLRTRILRAEMGWDAVVALLGASDDEPVVCSYSVCEGFPNAKTAGIEQDREGYDPATWEAMSKAERWEAAMAGLREDAGWLELKPETLGRPVYLDGTTLFDLRALWEDAEMSDRLVRLAAEMRR